MQSIRDEHSRSKTVDQPPQQELGVEEGKHTTGVEVGVSRVADVPVFASLT